MDKEVVWFIRLSMVYFLVGSFLGLLFTAYPGMMRQDFISVHVHLNLVGWMSMMIFGVGYHILPRFSGNPLWSRKLSVIQFWLANIGLIGMTVGWFMRGGGSDTGTDILAAFSTVMFVAIAMFVFNLMKTVKGVAK